MTEFNLNLLDGSIKIGGKRSVFHCNHYNSFLQKVICDTFGIDGKRMQINVSKEINKEMLLKLKSEKPDNDFKEIATETFRALALGLLDITDIGSGRAVVKNSHYGLGIFYKFGKQSSGICLYAAGFILAVKEILDGVELDASNITETTCIAMTDDIERACEFEVKL